MQGFWDDARKAQTVTRKRSALEQSLETFEKLERDVEDVRVLFELGAEVEDEATMDEAVALLPAVAGRVRSMELKRMLSGPADHASAIVTIHPGAGGTDAKDWAAMLLRMYLRWCERRGFKTEVIDFQESDEAGIDGASFTVKNWVAIGDASVVADVFVSVTVTV